MILVAIVLVPLLLAVITALIPRSRPVLAHGIAAVGMAVVTAFALWTASIVLSNNTPMQGPHAPWLDLGSFALGLGVYVDPMGAILAVIVSLLVTLVLIYNAWYMHGDALAARFPWQFCFFAFAMLGVVLSDNLFMSFVCWELVGLGSYLLIGFWFAKPAASDDPEYQRLKGAGARGVLEDQLSPAHAQLKGFVMNRIGDAGFLIGIGALLAAASVSGLHEPLTWSNLALLTQHSTLPGTFLGLSGSALLTLAAIGIFCGAIGKSAQFPLHTWLPDAMQGPTTASAIIHAATMVAAGVFLVARCYALFTPDALAVVGWIGGITCLLAASIACVQWDLKAVLAYSTISQLGLMFVGLGAGAAAGGQAAGMGHLFTHAMFKCLLFLCAGAVIHACAGCQDLARLGGLFRRMPVVAVTSLLAVLAICGAPLFSGFWSKDAVLAAALTHADITGGQAWGPFLLACAGSLLTGIYMLRWWIRIFLGSERVAEITAHAHDPVWYAKVVLIVLAPFTCIRFWDSGWIERAMSVPLEQSHQVTPYVSMIGYFLVLVVVIQRLFKPRGAEMSIAFRLFRDSFWMLFVGLGVIAIGGLVLANHGTQSSHIGSTLNAMLISLVLLSVGASLSVIVFWWLPRRGTDAALIVSQRLRVAFIACGELWGIDRLWDCVFTRGIGAGLARVTARLDLGSTQRLTEVENASSHPRDLSSLDGVIDGIGRACGQLGRVGSTFHAGRVGAYIAVAAIIGLGVLLVGMLL